MYFTFITVVLSLISVLSLLLGALVFFQKPRNHANTFFGFVSASACVWVISGVVLHYGNATGNVALVERINIISSLAALAVFFFSIFLFLSFPKGFLSINKKAAAVLASIFGSILFAFGAFPSFYIQDVILRPEFYMEEDIPGKGFTLYNLILIGSILAGLAIAFKKRISTKDKTEQAQLNYVFFGTVLSTFVGVSFGIVTEYIDPAMDVFWVSNTSFFIYILFIAVAVSKYHLFELKVVTVEVLTFAMWAVSLIEVILAETWEARAVRAVVLLIASVVAVSLLRSVFREVRQKEQLASLNTQLADLNEHLEEKVKEQTVEIRKAYEVEKKARHELEELDKAKTDFILTTQHHLRTPLTIIRSVFASLLPKKIGDPLSDLDGAFIEKGATATDNLAKLVNEFLDISQMEVGRSVLNKEPARIEPLARNVLDEFARAIEEKRLSVQVNFSDEAREAFVEIDIKKMQEAFRNLFDNAIRYTPSDGKIRIEGSVVLHPIEHIRLYQVSITDSGIGMTEEELSLLFKQAFQRGARAKEVYATGRGIGLLIARRIIEAHGGMIRAGSEGAGKGSVFALELKVA